MKPTKWVWTPVMPTRAEELAGLYVGGVIGMALIQDWWCQVNPGLNGTTPHSDWDGWYLSRYEWLRTGVSTTPGAYTQEVKLTMAKTDGEILVEVVSYPFSLHFFPPTGGFRETPTMLDWGPAPVATADPVPDPPTTGLTQFKDVWRLAAALEGELPVLPRPQLKVGYKTARGVGLRQGQGGISMGAGGLIRSGVGYRLARIGQQAQLISRGPARRGYDTYCKWAYHATLTVVTSGGSEETSGWNLVTPDPGVDFDATLVFNKVALVVIQERGAEAKAVAVGRYHVGFDELTVTNQPNGFDPPIQTTELVSFQNYSEAIETTAEGVVFNQGVLEPETDENLDTWPWAAISLTLVSSLYESGGWRYGNQNYINESYAEFVR